MRFLTVTLLLTAVALAVLPALVAADCDANCAAIQDARIDNQGCRIGCSNKGADVAVCQRRCVNEGGFPRPTWTAGCAAGCAGGDASAVAPDAPVESDTHECERFCKNTASELDQPGCTRGCDMKQDKPDAAQCAVQCLSGEPAHSFVATAAGCNLGCAELTCEKKCETDVFPANADRQGCKIGCDLRDNEGTCVGRCEREGETMEPEKWSFGCAVGCAHKDPVVEPTATCFDKCAALKDVRIDNQGCDIGCSHKVSDAMVCQRRCVNEGGFPRPTWTAGCAAGCAGGDASAVPTEAPVEADTHECEAYCASTNNVDRAGCKRGCDMKQSEHGTSECAERCTSGAPSSFAVGCDIGCRELTCVKKCEIDVVATNGDRLGCAAGCALRDDEGKCLGRCEFEGTPFIKNWAAGCAVGCKHTDPVARITEGVAPGLGAAGGQRCSDVAAPTCAKGFAFFPAKPCPNALCVAPAGITAACCVAEDTEAFAGATQCASHCKQTFIGTDSTKCGNACQAALSGFAPGCTYEEVADADTSEIVVQGCSYGHGLLGRGSCLRFCEHTTGTLGFTAQQRDACIGSCASAMRGVSGPKNDQACASLPCSVEGKHACIRGCSFGAAFGELTTRT